MCDWIVRHSNGTSSVIEAKGGKIGHALEQLQNGAKCAGGHYRCTVHMVLVVQPEVVKLAKASLVPKLGQHLRVVANGATI